jgi:hypothetical protein
MDKIVLKILEKQVFAIYIKQLATVNSNNIKYIKKYIGLINSSPCYHPLIDSVQPFRNAWNANEKRIGAIT